MSVILSYDFLVVASGVFLLAVTSALVGSFSVWRHQSMVGDALGHAAYPGVVFSFILLKSRNPFLLTLGAMGSAALAYWVIQYLQKEKKIPGDAALAVSLTGFFGLGMVLKSYIQGNEKFLHASQAGLKNYIFGSAAFIMREDVLLILVVCSVILLIFYRYRRELVYSTFDAESAEMMGIFPQKTDSILLVMMIAMIALGLRFVGAILIASFLLIPPLFASALSRKLLPSLIWAGFCGGTAGIVGTYFSATAKGLSTGPTIILCMGILTVIAFFIGHKSPFRRRR